MAALTIGILALQGDVREHQLALEDAGARVVRVRRAHELKAVDGLVIPGGESTTMMRLARTFDLLEPLREGVRNGLPMLATCAGMVLLADRLTGPEPGAGGGSITDETIGGIDITVRRNAFGRQVDSFESEVHVAGLRGAPVRAVFIRAPWVEQVGPAATPIAHISAGPRGEPVAARVVGVRQGNLLATAFHPELTGDRRLHQHLCDLAARAGAASAVSRPVRTVDRFRTTPTRY